MPFVPWEDASPPEGISAKWDNPSRPSMSRITLRSSAEDVAAAARGLSSARTASQLRPFIVLSKWVSRMIVQAASNVSLAWGTWAETKSAPSVSAATAAAITRKRVT